MQTRRANAALDEAFATAANDEEKVLVELRVTQRVVDQRVFALVLICRSSYRGAIEFMRDVMGFHVSLGSVHNVLAAAARRAGDINAGIELSAVRVGLHDEIFQGSYRYWPAWTPHRRIGTCWRVKRTATATPGMCICWSPRRRD